MDSRDIHSPGLDKKTNLPSDLEGAFFLDYYQSIERMLPNFSNRLTFKGRIECLDYETISSICSALDNLSSCFGTLNAIRKLEKDHFRSAHPDDPEYIAFLKDTQENIERFERAVLKVQRVTASGVSVVFSLKKFDRF